MQVPNHTSPTFEALAREKLTPSAWCYSESGAG